MDPAKRCLSVICRSWSGLVRDLSGTDSKACLQGASDEPYFVALCVTRQLCDVSDACFRLKAPFRPSATYFDGAKVGKPPGSVSGPTSSGSFALTLIRGPLQRAILGPVQLARTHVIHKSY